MSMLARTPKQIGNIVQRHRKRRGWNQTQLGKKAGLRQARPGSDIFISHLSRGRIFRYISWPCSPIAGLICLTKQPPHMPIAPLGLTVRMPSEFLVSDRPSFRYNPAEIHVGFHPLGLSPPRPVPKFITWNGPRLARIPG